MFKKRKRTEAEIPTASMADIGFMLMIFFLLTTTFDVDTGIGLVLPPPVESTEQVKMKKENIANILVNAAGEVLLDGEIILVPQISPTMKNKITENDKLVVSVKTDRETPYRVYVDVMDQLKQAYNELREEYARHKFGMGLNQLTKKQQDEVREALPQRISIAEPEKTQ
jgi:biopolymer transport protein ExbD